MNNNQNQITTVGKIANGEYDAFISANNLIFMQRVRILVIGITFLLFCFGVVKVWVMHYGDSVVNDHLLSNWDDYEKAYGYLKQNLHIKQHVFLSEVSVDKNMKHYPTTSQNLKLGFEFFGIGICLLVIFIVTIKIRIIKQKLANL